MKHADGNGLIAVFFMYIVYLLRRFGDDYTNFKACKKRIIFHTRTCILRLHKIFISTRKSHYNHTKLFKKKSFNFVRLIVQNVFTYCCDMVKFAQRAGT